MGHYYLKICGSCCSVLAFFILLAPKNLTIIGLMLIAAIGISVYCIRHNILFGFRGNKKDYFFAIIISLFFIPIFYIRWLESSKLEILTNILSVRKSFFLISSASILTIFSFSVLLKIIQLLNKISYGKTVNQEREKERISSGSVKVILAVTAVVIITIFSKSSFLYPFNDWVDSNCFFTVGKSILSGKVPYRDLYEQKGPLLYFIHTFAALISYDSFLGVYFVEIIACFAFLFFSYKTLSLFITNKMCVYTIPAFACFVYSAPNFCHGDSAEELCLPFLAYALYVGMKYMKTDVLPGFKECLLIGITSACVLWIKYTMLGFYIGWIIIPAILLIQKKRYKELLHIIRTIAIGVVMVSVPVLLYFVYHHAVGNLLEAYFYNNMFLYSGVSGMSKNPVLRLYYNLSCAFESNLPLMILLFLGMVSVSKERKVFSQLSVTFLCTSIFTLSFSTIYAYYSFTLNVFSIFGLIPIVNLLYQMQHGFSKMTITGVNVISLIICLFISSNLYLMFQEKDDMPQYQFQKIICQKENPTLLNYGFLDGGFYTTCNIVPNCKYFCKLNIPLEEMYDVQNQYIEDGLVDFVVTRNQEINSVNYRQVASSSFLFQGIKFHYYLYQLKTHL